MFKQLSFLAILVYVCVGMSACAVKPKETKTTFAPPKVGEKKFEKMYNGAIYQDGMMLDLFNDTQARHVGDVITIKLVESATALSSADTKAEKGQNVDLPSPTVAGGEVTKDDKKVLENKLKGERDFRGSGESNQSHNFQAVIAVSVIDVLPNRHLVVRGEKLITLNQSEEFIRFSGIIRPQDIDQNNTIESQKVANVNISYAGQGALSHTNKMGPLANFFQSATYPY